MRKPENDYDDRPWGEQQPQADYLERDTYDDYDGPSDDGG